MFCLKKLEYENSENVSDDELYNLFETAFVKFQDKIMFNNLKFKTVGYIDLGLKYIEFSHKSFDLINKKILNLTNRIPSVIWIENY